MTDSDSAREATETQAHGRLSAKHGLSLGWYHELPDYVGLPLVYAGDRHALTFGATGAGKTTRLLMPNLLGDNLSDRSVIAVDPKGELSAVCAMWRHKLGHKVRILDPFGKLKELVGASPEHRYLHERDLIESAGFNPLSALDPESDNFYDDAAAIGEALIKIAEHEPHWTESAQGLVVGLIMWEVVRPKKPGEIASLENVRDMLTEHDEYADIDGEPTLVRGLTATARVIVKACAEEDEDGNERSPENIIKAGFEIASLVSRFTQQTKELLSIQSAADTQTRWMLSRRVRADLKKPNPIDFRDLKNEKTTVFVILPAERMRTHSVWLRLVIVSALRSLYRRGGLHTMLLIDEMAALGHLSPIEDAFGLVRGYRVQIVGYWQDLAQLKALYKERWESFVANAGVLQSFSPNDLTSADWLSNRSGKKFIYKEAASRGSTMAVKGDFSSQHGTSSNPIEQPLWSTFELFGCPTGTGVIFLAGLAPGFRFKAHRYDDIKALDRRHLPNPYDERLKAL